MEREQVLEKPLKPTLRPGSTPGTMGLFRSFFFFLVLYLLQESNTSLVQLNNNGYEGIIIAIDPGVPEDETLIEQIKVRKKWIFSCLNYREGKKVSR